MDYLPYYLFIHVFLLGDICIAAIFKEQHFRLHHLQKLRKRHTLFDSSALCKAFGCRNGFCKESEMRKYRVVCECFSGYEGTLCDRLKCPYSCGVHGTCAKSGNILYCKCDEGYTGPVCDRAEVHDARLPIKTEPQENRSRNNILSKIGQLVLRSQDSYSSSGDTFRVPGTDTWYAHTVTPNKVKVSQFHSHAEVDTNVTPDVCAPGFQCYHGHCDREAMTYGLFQCVCRPDYTGLFCEKRCTLNCKNGGQCMVMEDGHQFCSCPFDYKGHYCEKAVAMN